MKLHSTLGFWRTNARWNLENLLNMGQLTDNLGRNIGPWNELLGLLTRHQTLDIKYASLHVYRVAIEIF